MATYSTTAKIREEAGFKNNTYILDASIDVQRTRAYARINSYLGTRTTIPSLSDTNFIDSPASQLLESIEVMLGAALLLIQEYGPEGRDTDKDGYRRQVEVTKMLEEIRDGKISLFGNDGHTLPQVDSSDKASGQIRAFIPEASERRFSVNDTF